LKQAAPVLQMRVWEAWQSAALVGAAASWGEPAGGNDAALRLTWLRPPLTRGDRPDQVEVTPLSRLGLLFRERTFLGQDETPPALLYLAVRAARRALAADPSDARASLALGEAYRALFHATRERAWALRFPKLVELRRAQASAALNQAVTLDPGLARAHLLLA